MPQRCFRKHHNHHRQQTTNDLRATVPYTTANTTTALGLRFRVGGPPPKPGAQLSPRKLAEGRVPAPLPVGRQEDRVVRELGPPPVAAQVEGDHAGRVLGFLVFDSIRSCSFCLSSSSCRRLLFCCRQRNGENKRRREADRDGGKKGVVGDRATREVDRRCEGMQAGMETGTAARGTR